MIFVGNIPGPFYSIVNSIQTADDRTKRHRIIGDHCLC